MYALASFFADTSLRAEVYHDSQRTMTHSAVTGISCAAAVRIHGETGASQHQVFEWLDQLGFDRYITHDSAHGAVSFALAQSFCNDWIPNSDTTGLSTTLALDTDNNPRDLEREIMVTMVAGPHAFAFPNVEEWMAAVRIRCNIVQAARRTQLGFHTTELERPTDYWAYNEDTGFTVLRGRSLIDALQRATQPDTTCKLYSFSCHRASEYVNLLAIAQELAHTDPVLLDSIQRRCEKQAIRSGPFHDTFLYEYGSLDAPLPPGYCVPGDRMWFRNPDSHSSDVSGYEGSWVFYLGNGLFSNFWQRGKDYTLTSKCIEIYHWRHATVQDTDGELRIDESVVAPLTQQTLSDPYAVRDIVSKMAVLRDPAGVYASGGIIDASREFPRCVCPGTADMTLPDLPADLPQ
jgi:hypothetical protein